MSLKFLARPVLAAALATVTLAAPLAFAGAPPRTWPRPGAVRPAKPAEAQQKQARPQIEVTFVIDTTGSMSGLIEGAKQKIFSIASRIATGKPTPRLKVGLVAYRDVGDEYVTKRFDLSEDLDTVFTHLRQFQADGGGDSPEHVGRGLGEAVSKMSWSDNRETMKVIFLVGDAPPAERGDSVELQALGEAGQGAPHRGEHGALRRGCRDGHLVAVRLQADGRHLRHHRPGGRHAGGGDAV